MATYYLDNAQRTAIRRLARSWRWRSEWPTWLLMGVIYGGWFGCVISWQSLGAWVGTPLLILFTCWYMSLQHELIHGHPTRFARVNQLFGTLPLAVWYPYGLYRDSHLAHHRHDHLTVPVDDPESYYFTPQHWQRLPRWQQNIIHARNTFIGRLLLAPLLDILATIASAWTAFRQGDKPAMGMWFLHATLLVALLSWMAQQGLSPLWFVLAVSYPALALTKVRSFLEHRAADDPLARSVINDAAWPWRLLFLNLNYHSIHHDLPGVPWYGLRTLWLRDASRYQQRNHGFVVRGYSEWVRQFWKKAVDVTAHPGGGHE